MRENELLIYKNFGEDGQLLEDMAWLMAHYKDVDYLEQRVIEAIQEVLGSPSNVGNLIRILRDQAEQIQGGAVARLRALLAREKDIAVKLDNAMDAIMNGLTSPTLKAKVTDLEIEKAQISRELRALKATVDASAIPEERLQEILAYIVSTASSDASALLSIVNRVEVGKDTITIWTILDADPNGHFDYDTKGVTITEGFPSGVPTVFVTREFVVISVPREKASIE